VTAFAGATAGDRKMEATEFTCREEDFLHAQRLHQIVALRGRRFAVRIGVVACALGLLFAVVEPGEAIFRVSSGLALAAVYVGVMSIFVLAGRFFFLPRVSRRQFLQRKDFRGVIAYEIQSPRISVTYKDGGAQTTTEDFLKWAENRTTILLYRSDNMFNFIPKRAVSDAFYAAFVAELARAAVPRAGFQNS